MISRAARRWVAPNVPMLLGALAALAGYAMPWFKISDSYDWWFSGWAYADLSTGGGWTLVTMGWLVLALGGSLWAGRSRAATMTAVVGGVAAMFSALAVVAASFGTMPQRDSLNWIGEMPFGLGLPLMAGGFGLMLAGALRTPGGERSWEPTR